MLLVDLCLVALLLGLPQEVSMMFICRADLICSQEASHPGSRLANRPNQPASQPSDQLPSRTTDQPARQPVSHPANHPLILDSCFVQFKPHRIWVDRDVQDMVTGVRKCTPWYKSSLLFLSTSEPNHGNYFSSMDGADVRGARS